MSGNLTQLKSLESDPAQNLAVGIPIHLTIRVAGQQPRHCHDGTMFVQNRDSVSHLPWLIILRYVMGDEQTLAPGLAKTQSHMPDRFSFEIEYL